MAAVGDKNNPDQLDDIFRRLFLFSKYLGLFPYNIKYGKFKMSVILFGLSFGMIGVWSTVVFNFVDFDRWSAEDHLLKKLSHYLPIFTLFTVLPCNALWLSFNAKKLTYVLQTLKNMKTKASPKPSYRYTQLFIAVLVAEFIYEFYHYQTIEQRATGYVYLFMVLSIFLIADQFASFLSVLRNYYEHICDHLDLDRAVEFTNTHDLLGRCCHEVNDCYSPQLLLIMISVFVYIVSGLYTLIIMYMEKKETDIIQINYLIMFVATIFHFLTGCRLTTCQAKKFDNLLYRLIINDKSKSLMRNNRILLHFKAMKDLEFSAMEFFNFDYSLICSVVSTATTYIVILVQFS